MLQNWMILKKKNIFGVLGGFEILIFKWLFLIYFFRRRVFILHFFPTHFRRMFHNPINLTLLSIFIRSKSWKFLYIFRKFLTNWRFRERLDLLGWIWTCLFIHFIFKIQKYFNKLYCSLSEDTHLAFGSAFSFFETFRKLDHLNAKVGFFPFDLKLELNKFSIYVYLLYLNIYECVCILIHCKSDPK